MLQVSWIGWRNKNNIIRGVEEERIPKFHPHGEVILACQVGHNVHKFSFTI